MKKEYLRLDTNMANYITIPKESDMPIGRFTTVSSRYRESKIVFYKTLTNKVMRRLGSHR